MDAVGVKKERLHKAFLDLESHSSALVNFTLQWKELEEHFDSIEQAMRKRFQELGEKEQKNGAVTQSSSPPKADAPVTKETTPAISKTTTTTTTTTPAPATEVKPRAQLKSLCEKMDAEGLRKFIVDQRKEVASLRNESPAALRFAADPAKLVLQAMEGFYPADRSAKADKKDTGLPAQRRACILLLEALVPVVDEVSSDSKEQAKKIAVEWKSKVTIDTEAANGNSLEAQAFLQLLASYGISSEFKADDLCELVLLISRRRQTPELCRALGLTEKMPGRGPAPGTLVQVPPVPGTVGPPSAVPGYRPCEEPWRSPERDSNSRLILLARMTQALTPVLDGGLLFFESFVENFRQPPFYHVLLLLTLNIMLQGDTESGDDWTEAPNNHTCTLKCELSLIPLLLHKLTEVIVYRRASIVNFAVFCAVSECMHQSVSITLILQNYPIPFRVSEQKLFPEQRSFTKSSPLRDVVEKLISSGRQIEAVNFAHAFGLVDKFSPVPLLKAYLKDAKKVSQETLKSGNNSTAAQRFECYHVLPQNEATSKELSAVRAVIKCIEEHKLESQFSENLEKRVAQLEKAKADRKRSAVAVKSQTKRPRANGGGAGAYVPPTSTVERAPNAYAASAADRSLFRPADRAQFPGAVAGVAPYGLAGQGTYDRSGQAIYGSAYGVGSRSPVSMSRSQLYPSDNLHSSLLGAGSYNASTNFGSYNFGSSMPPPPYQSSYLH
eukprot:Gb_32064 [translate_table: standard]